MSSDPVSHVVVAGRLVCCGSSADSAVRALEAATAALRGRLTAGVREVRDDVFTGLTILPL